ncbi:hypothetical protein TNCV_1870611 [Trichonephila clavipes]|nr:hypothetical protein TNCV_1870611 [Trichonephila clavipes]
MIVWRLGSPSGVTENIRSSPSPTKSGVEPEAGCHRGRLLGFGPARILPPRCGGCSFAMREKGGNRLVQGPDYMVDALKLSNQAPRVSGEPLQTCVAWSCPDETQYLFC